MLWSWGCAFVFALVPVGARAADQTDLTGLTLYETIVQEGETHLRYVAGPEFGPLTYDRAFPTFQSLCEMPQDLSGAVVVMVLQKPVPFGEPLGEIVAFAEMFSRKGSVCTPLGFSE